MKLYLLLFCSTLISLYSFSQEVYETALGGGTVIESSLEFSPDSGEVCNYLMHDSSICSHNWIIDQTYAYWNAPVTITGSEIIQLVNEGENFVLPRYGTMWSGFKKGHNGLDIHLNTGDSVRSAFNGVVRYATYNKGGFGNLVIIRHFNGLETYYAHLSDMFVGSGDTLIAGQVLGLGGSTGRSKGPHLHFEVRFQDQPLDPLSFIDFYSKRLKTYELTLSPEVFEPWTYGIDNTKTGEEVASRKIVTEDTRPAGFENIVYTSKVVATGSSSSSAGSEENSATTSTKKYYTVKSGDTLYRIALNYDTTVSNLCSLNGIKETSILQIGQKIRYQ